MLTNKEIGTVQKSVKDAVEERMPFVFQVLADATRLKIFRLLVKQKDLCVTDIAKVFKISIPAVSYQLKVMEMVGLVRREKMGKMVCYELKKDDPFVRKIIKIIQ